MNVRITRLLEKIKQLGIGQQQEFISLYGDIVAGRQGCSYWTQDRCREYAATHPEEGRAAGAIRVITLDCPKIDETDWCGLGNQKYDSDGSPLPAPERPCAECEHLILAIKRDNQDN